MAYSTGLSMYSGFAKKLDLAKKVSAAKCKAREPLTEEAKQRQAQVQKAWRDKRKAENLAQAELIRSRQPIPI